jgi:2-keto-3-deoxy-L-rhamnonate aldolase RhmA
MSFKRVVLSALACAVLFMAIAQAQAPAQKPGAPAKLYNTTKQKLLDGKQVVCGTVTSTDPDMYRYMAEAGWDCLWIEMEHSGLTTETVLRGLWTAKAGPATPMIRVPDATEQDILRAFDMGALGIIVPQVETVQKAQDAVKWAKYPPIGHRSSGNRQANAIWGPTYRDTINDNMLIVVMIETPAGVKVADQIAAVPGIDVVFVASGDLGSFSGTTQGQPAYEAMATAIHDATLKNKKWVGGPSSWMSRPGYSFFQGGSEEGLIRAGTKLALQPPAPAK